MHTHIENNAITQTHDPSCNVVTTCIPSTLNLFEVISARLLCFFSFLLNSNLTTYIYITYERHWGTSEWQSGLLQASCQTGKALLRQGINIT